MVRSLEKPVADPTYLEFFGLTRPPFGRLADTSQLYHTEQYSLLMEHLVSARSNPDSLVVVCGASGSGKTTLLNHYITGLGPKLSFAAVNETCRGEEQFYRELLRQIGFSDITGTAGELQNITREFLVYSGNAGDPVLVIIDNAHLVDPAILEALRWLSDVKVKGRRVVSVILSGDADIVRIIDAPAMSQTNFQSHVVFHIRNYTEEETASYVWHRLRFSGGNDGVKLASEALPLIHRYSGGTPQLINKLCNDLLTEASTLKSRVITDKIVRTVADRQRILPHVIPLHGKGRRSTDPDFKSVQAVPDAKQHNQVAESSLAESIDQSVAETASAVPRNVLQQVSRLSEQVDDLRADKLRALHEIGVHIKDIGALRNQLDSKTSEIDKLAGAFHARDDELARQKQALADSVTALQKSENAAAKLAAELEQERSGRESAEAEREKAAAAVENLTGLKQELQATADDLKSELEVVGGRSAEVEVLQKTAADLKGELDGKNGELDALRDELELRDQGIADLEKRLKAAQKDHASAQQRMKALKSPKELKAVLKASDKLAANLAAETRTHEAAQDELAKAKASVEELNRLREELQSTVSDLQAELKVAEERAAEIELFERKTAELEKEIEGKTSELDSLRHESELRDQALAELEVLEKNTAALKDEIEGKTGELDSLRHELGLRDQALAELETNLDASRKDHASAERRIKAMKDPQELQEIVKASEKLAADLEGETLRREAMQEELAAATSELEKLDQQKQELQSTVDELKAEFEVAAERALEVEVLQQNTADLKGEIDGKVGELDSLREELESLQGELKARDEMLASLDKRLDESESECKLVQRRMLALKSPRELQEIEEASNKLAADLEEEARLREAAEKELANAATNVDELNKRKEELQATGDDLKADVKAAEERAAEFEALEKSAADLRDEIEGKNVQLSSLQEESNSLRGELDSRNQALADLELRLEESQNECLAAQDRIKALKNPEDLQEVEKAADKLAADLEKEVRARAAAEQELATSAAAVDELNKLKGDLQANVDSLKADLEAAERRANEFEALEKDAAGLKGEIEERSGELESQRDELDSLRAELDSRNQALADLELRLEESQNECLAAQDRIKALKNPEDLQEVEKAADKLAADLEKEVRARAAAEQELATSAATVDELNKLKEDLQANVDSLKADLEAAEQRANEFEALEKDAAGLKGEIEERSGELGALRDELGSLKAELESRNEALAELEGRLEESQDIEKTARRLAAELEEETSAVMAAEKELANATATVEELSQQKEELQATIRDLNTDLRLAGERAIDFDVLERDVTDLKVEIEKKTDELEFRNKILADFEDQLAATHSKDEPHRRQASAPNEADDSVLEQTASASAHDTRLGSSPVVAKFEESISDVRAYQSLKRYRPASYDGLIETYRKLTGLDRTDKQVNDALRSEQAVIIERMLPRASDDALLTYAQVIADQLREFERDGALPCFTLLIPKTRRSNSAWPIYSETTKESELAVLDKTVRTYKADRQLPAQDDVWPDLEPVFQELIKEYGEDNVSALENSDGPGIDRLLACRIARSLYSGILRLSKRKAVTALRWILSP